MGRGSSALAALGVSPGSSINFGGQTFTWPDSQAGQPDSDGSSQRFTVNLPNWDAPRTGDSVVFTTAFRNRPGNTQDTDQVSVFYVGVPLAAGKTVKQLILPADGDTVGVGVPSLHVWSVAIG